MDMVRRMLPSGPNLDVGGGERGRGRGSDLDVHGVEEEKGEELSSLGSDFMPQNGKWPRQGRIQLCGTSIAPLLPKFTTCGDSCQGSMD